MHHEYLSEPPDALTAGNLTIEIVDYTIGQTIEVTQFPFILYLEAHLPGTTGETYRCVDLQVFKDFQNISCTTLTHRFLVQECRLEVDSEGTIQAESRVSGLRGSMVSVVIMLRDGKTRLRKPDV